MTLKQTPLNAAHRAMGAKMVDFGGWDMPVNYGSQLDEHHQVRNDSGMFDVSHMRVVDIKGSGVRAFLRLLLANNVDKLQHPGKALYSCMLLENGGVIDDLIVYFMSEEWFRIVVNAGTADKDIAWMKQQATKHAPQLTIADHPELAMIAVQGSNARAKVWEALPGSKELTENLAPFNAVEMGTMFIARTDLNDNALARRIFSPGEYLPAPQDISAGFPANQELGIKLRLDTTASNRLAIDWYCII